MKCLSVKESIAIVEIVIALLCLPAILLLSFVLTFPDDMKMFLYQCSLATTMVLCLLFGFSTWFYNSNYPKTRFHVRIFIVIVLWTMFIFGVVTGVLFDMQFFDKYLYGHFEHDILDGAETLTLYAAMIFGIIVLFLLFIVNIILTVGVCRRARKGRNRSTRR
ncbi:uncharacterized protein Lgt isoform X1 [Zeugodacus cucurbitae]|uniref:Anoctamin-10 n=1 Tax=Zeugodacus cucurbitae TaxID=28588 RepID=A0A0A1WN32_ZEUCU|nr:uncharacterized protein Lgt isoform X1 [Zeugodacus cucurbitae]XP_011181626.2 uncharacterized protein Lgt isoform X1 [Zeugodacus cucurbitae]XP_011181627.2 uncharacterized protein Lgt isoform X1 [Zeugodacus cucurbitae]XP_011181630.2 uncharacterized protein Lgt isoform X1 [Zeugodacus cucurbitae]XP_028895777.1 uncharacterized protein Lgt isoform X1 [Zeugodacus cucurbitae]XP_054087440.1 uncharacterized protein Lgt isoform X1 [Zeugodacus cucurbitae]XP_054087441.1 uncharacterized protein Lgt isof